MYKKIIVFIVSILSIAICLQSIIHSYNIMVHGSQSMGKIISYDSSKGKHGDIYTPIVEYTCNGSDYIVRGPDMQFKWFKQGSYTKIFCIRQTFIFPYYVGTYTPICFIFLFLLVILSLLRGARVEVISFLNK